MPRATPQGRLVTSGKASEELHRFALRLKTSWSTEGFARRWSSRPHTDERPTASKLAKTGGKITDNGRMVHDGVHHTMSDMGSARVLRCYSHHAQTFA